jgi:hypothetical protein
MKTTIMIFSMVSIFCQVHAQKLMEKDVPQAVAMAFKKEHPSIKEVDWKKEAGNYEAEFEENKMELAAKYTVSGKLIETQMEITVSTLPAPALEYLKNNYKGEKIEEASKITAANGIVMYEAEVKGMDVIFDSKGNFMKTLDY